MLPSEGLKIRRSLIALYEAQLDSFQSMLARAKEQGVTDLATFHEFIELTDFIVTQASENHEITLTWEEMSTEFQERLIASSWMVVKSYLTHTAEEPILNGTKVTIALEVVHDALAILNVRINGEYTFESPEISCPIKSWYYENQYRLSFFPETPFKDKIKS